MINVLGLDIGGANTKFVLLNEQGNILTCGSDYFPIWRKIQLYHQYLKKLKKKLTKDFGKINYVAFVTTAELADCFETKREGIKELAAIILKVFDKCNKEPVIFSVRDQFIFASAAENNWLDVAASNWAIAAKYLSLSYPNSLLVDIGSTTTDIISIIGKNISAKGKNDLERLKNNELVYSGLLRTNVSAIIRHVFLDGKKIPIASELFATTGDIYLILGLITENDYTVETADGKPATFPFACNRIAKIVCSDMNQLSIEEVKQIALQVQNAQIKQIDRCLKIIIKRYKNSSKIEPTLILAGSGAHAIGLQLLKRNTFREAIFLKDILSEKISTILPAYATAFVFLNDILLKTNKRGITGN